MNFEYLKEFNLNPSLANCITNLISYKEGAPYICQIMDFVVPEHKEVVNVNPKKNYLAKRKSGGNNSKTREVTKPKQSYSYFVIIEKNALMLLQNLEFNSKEEIELALNSLCMLNEEYFGIINSEVLKSKFPYLENFFQELDAWRSKRGRATIDASALLNIYNEALVNVNSFYRE